MKTAAFFGGLALAALLLRPVHAQTLDLSGSQQNGPPLPIQINAAQSIQWNQQAQTVTAIGNAKAVRGNVTVTADELVAHYRKKATPPGAQPAPTPTPANSTGSSDPLDQGNNQLYELDAIGHVHIYTATDNAWGDHAVYSLDDQVLVLTGQHLKLTTPHDVITAKDALEYYSQKRMAVARGDALIVADNGRSIAADVLIGYLAPPNTSTSTSGQKTAANSNQNTDPLDQAGQLQKVDAIGHVVIKTTTDTATGDRGVYLPPTGLARLGGDVHIIRGPNELTGNDALVNMKTGVATLLASPGGQVAGTIVPNTANATPGTAPTKGAK